MHQQHDGCVRSCTPPLRTEQASVSASDRQEYADCKSADCHLARTEQSTRLSDARAVVAAVLDTILREYGAPSNRDLALWCGVDESTIRKWRDGRKPIPYAARKALPRKVARELDRRLDAVVRETLTVSELLAEQQAITAEISKRVEGKK